MLRVSASNVVGIAGIVLSILVFVLDKAGKLKGGLLHVLLSVAATMTLFIALGNSWVTDSPEKWKWWRVALMICVVGFSYSGIAIWISEDETIPPTSASSSPLDNSPSQASSGLQSSPELSPTGANEYMDYIPANTLTIIGGKGGFPTIPAGSISNVLLQSGTTASVRIVYVGSFQPDLVDQLFAEFQRAQWKPEIIHITAILNDDIENGSVVLLSPDFGSKQVIAALKALDNAGLVFQVRAAGKASVGPEAATMPDLTVIIKSAGL